jgi:superfamily II DNA or RNA helicase
MPSFPDPDRPVLLTISLSPAGTLHLHSGSPGDVLPGDVAWRIEKAFGQNQGLFHLGSRETQTKLPPIMAYWRDFSRHFMQAVSALPTLPKKGAPLALPLSDEEITHWRGSAPPMQGLDFLTDETLRGLWAELETTLQHHMARFPASAARFFQNLHPTWHKVGRVTLHLAENTDDPDRPFTFMATYAVTTRSATGTNSRQIPLGEAWKTYAGPQHREQLRSLLEPLKEAAKQNFILTSLLESGRLYEGVTWTPGEAYIFLQDAARLETFGLIIRIPNWWKARARPQVRVTIGESTQSHLNAQSLLDFSVELKLGDQALTPEEWQKVQESEAGLVLIKGQWVEVDRARLKQVLDHWKKVERSVSKEGISFFDGMRLLAGSPLGGPENPEPESPRPWSAVVAGKTLSNLLRKLTDPKEAERVHPGETLHATLRPYQDVGLRWLWLVTQLGLGACLADDMGLGKTIQVLALLLLMKQAGPSLPHLLVVPASLLGNWLSEIKRFAPSLRVKVIHPSTDPDFDPSQKADLDGIDIVLTTYGGLVRWDWLVKRAWHLVVLDEAQAIKNPQSQQTQAVKKLKSRQRLALTGTPVENRLSDLWSLFDFLSPGLLGTQREFIQGLEGLASRAAVDFQPLRALVRPYILRRLKSDKSVISDLPQKTELKAYCALSPFQAALYQQAVDQLSGQMEHLSGLKRRGTILAYLMRLKQICNHPSHWLADGRFDPKDSGKFARLRELSEVIADKQEKALIFTQFRAMTRPLAAFLEEVFERPGLVLDGHTPVRERPSLVADFQNPDGPPFFVLSLKAGGTGLNLTAATHVIHFDRWWNPAVENQATDRAYRIGQTKNVLVHKFICRGTVEEKIDALIESKISLAQGIIDSNGEKLLTEMTNEELTQLLRLDLATALQEAEIPGTSSTPGPTSGVK